MIISLSAKGRKPQKRQKQLNSSIKNYGEIPKRPKADYVGTQPDKHPLEVSPRRLRPPASGYSLSIGAKIQLNTLFIITTEKYPRGRRPTKSGLSLINIHWKFLQDGFVPLLRDTPLALEPKYNSILYLYIYGEIPKRPKGLPC